MAQSWEFEAQQGRAWKEDFVIYDGNGAVQNLTGFLATFTVKPCATGSGVTTVSKTIGSGITATVATGILTVQLDSTDYCMAAAGDYYYSLAITDTAGKIWGPAPAPGHQGILHVELLGTE